ncbi:MAG: P-loop NTPase fold protein [Rhodoferax sp.]
MPNASEIENFVSTFLASNARKGALLISGEWGSGKTHLVLTKLLPLATQSGFKTVYLTIADIETQEAFDRKLFLASYQLLDSKTKSRLAQTTFGIAYSWFASKGVPVKELIETDSALTNKTLLVVDDLERADVQLRKRVLYKVANLVETRGVRALFLADENRMAGDADYALIKEKSITRTVLFQPTFLELSTTATEIVYAASPNADLSTKKWQLQEHLSPTEFSELLNTALTRGNSRNLRTAIAIAIDACELVEEVKFHQSEDATSLVKTMVYSTLAIAIELKENKNNSTALRKYASSSTELPWIHFMPNGDPLKDYLTTFEKKYVDGLDFAFLRSSSLLDFLEHGGCNFDLLAKDIAALSPNEESAFAYTRLGKYQSLKKDEFADLLQKALSELDDLKIRSFHSLAVSAQTLFFLSSRKLFKLQQVELRLIYLDVIDKLGAEYINGAEDISLDFESALIWQQPEGELKVVLEKIQSKVNELDQVKFARTKTTEIEKLRNDANSFVSFLVSVDSRFASRSCLTPSDATQIAGILRSIVTNDAIPHKALYQVGKGLAYRYEKQGFGSGFHEELAFLEQLNSHVSEIQIAEDETLLRDAMISLRTTIENGIETLRSK